MRDGNGECLMDEPRRSNWKDAADLELPPCPKCGAVNRPGVVYIEVVNHEYVCWVCANTWRIAP